MSDRSSQQTRILLLLLRNLALYSLMLHGYRHFREEISIVFLSASFLLSLMLAVYLESQELRFPVALLLSAALPFILRGFFFLLFKLIATIDPVPESDFLLLSFDRDFYPALVPWTIVWLFNFQALRHPGFITVELFLNGFLLILVFITEAGFRIRLYHPTFFILFLSLFILIEACVLMLAPSLEKAKEQDNRIRFDAGLGSGIPGDSPAGLVSGLKNMIPIVVVIALLLGLLSVLLTKRYSNEALKTGGGLMEPTLFRFDFSRYIKLESRIEVSDDLVMLFRKDGPANSILLCRMTLSQYDPQSGFHQSRNTEYERLPVSVSDTAEDFFDPQYTERMQIGQEYFIINFDPTSLIAMNYPTRVVPLKNWDSSSFLRIYRVQSKVSTVVAADLSHEPFPTMEEEILEYYTDYGNEENIQLLAREITAEEESYYGKIMAILSYLKENYRYSFNPGLAEDGNQLRHFLFESKQGYCSYFAFAMALMARSLGIPARVAVGFLVDPSKEVLNFYEIRSYQAHAWVEVFFNDYGWIEFDPTSENLAPDMDVRFVFGFDFIKLSSLIEEILSHQEQLTEEIPEDISLEDRIYRMGQGIMQGVGFLARFWYLIVPLGYLFFLLSVKAYPYLGFLLTGDPRNKTRYLYSYSLVILRGTGIKKTQEESLMEYSERLERSYELKLADWTAGYLNAVFGNRQERHDFSESVALYRNFIDSYRRTRTIWIRFLAYLNPAGILKRGG